MITEFPSLIENTKGGLYYDSTGDANLDLFSAVSRFQSEDELIEIFSKALAEDDILALANLLYILDVREGKGERRIFKVLFRYLCENHDYYALEILYHIGELGRWDYILEGLKTPIEDRVINLISQQLREDMESENPSLLTKWLPSHRTHNENNPTARYIAKRLGMNQAEYRKTLSAIRKKLNLVETRLTDKEYGDIDFEKVPTKAMIKYRKAFGRSAQPYYDSYLRSLKEGKAKVNTKGLYCYEIIRKILKSIYGASRITEGGHQDEVELFTAMWEGQKDFIKGWNRNVLVMADTSGSMTEPQWLPMANSIGLALYIAERNTGIFKNMFLTFSDSPRLQTIKGKNIFEKVLNIESIVANTDIDAAFKLLLELKPDPSEMPSHIIIISDMEFDAGVYCYGSGLEEYTNFSGWRKAFNEEGYRLPKIIFWNVAGEVGGVPTVGATNDVIMISGFSTSILENILEPERFNPKDFMREKLKKYIDILEDRVEKPNDEA